MAITSSMFGPTVLDGKDAEQMIKQMCSTPAESKARANASVERARQMKEKLAKLSVQS
ncbi:hypothetical protein N5923_06725 [Erwiniaceae bacterium BAC15a-03b]|uniref:Uncharacterized protein n=1 Tax=Winslowiella arboricola TaxID=2978220 RepID=A0A9J6PIK0_9GAMM|nr:hypothetical protein [Winslowiella arboricola]MCU5771362.1 hypothetical protein [Winslowiella arboricola]MCU5777186.1 hypothetical protein [Winslowiella arboricola]